MARKDNVSDTYNLGDMGVGEIYSRQSRVAGRLRDWLAWQNAKLLRPGFWSKAGCAHVQTDDMVISLRRPRKARAKSAPHPTARHQAFVVTVSTISLEGTHYILAVHPHYLPPPHCPKPDELVLERRLRVPAWASPWAALWHEFEPGRERNAPSPNISLAGKFIHEHYAHLAHFLVVGKLLAQCPQVFHYIDGSKPLMAAAVTAFAERIKAGTSEVAVLQRNPKEPTRRRVPKGEGQLKKTLGEWEARVKEQIDDPALFDLGGDEALERKVLAKVWKTAPRSAYTDKSKWAWLEWPPSAEAVRDPRTLWLTWMPGKTTEQGFEFLKRATLRSVDSSPPFAPIPSGRRRARQLQDEGGTCLWGVQCQSDRRLQRVDRRHGAVQLQPQAQGMEQVRDDPGRRNGRRAEHEQIVLEEAERETDIPLGRSPPQRLLRPRVEL